MSGEMISLAKAIHTEKMADCSKCQHGQVGFRRLGDDLWFDCSNPWHRGQSLIPSFVCEQYEARSKTDEALDRMFSDAPALQALGVMFAEKMKKPKTILRKKRG